MTVDGGLLSAGAIAAAEAVTIGVMVVRRHRRERGRTLVLTVAYHGKDATESTETNTAPDDPVTPPE